MTELAHPVAAPHLRLPGAAEELVGAGQLAHVVTLNPDGSPHVTGVWVAADDGDIVFASMFSWRKTRNLRRDPRIAVSLESAEFHDSGLREYLFVRGRAEITEGGAFALIRRMAETYIGPGAQIPPDELRVHTGHIVRIKAEEIGGVGPWVGAPPGLPKK
jgi:PPOX class probable F420-dependent enzyme